MWWKKKPKIICKHDMSNINQNITDHSCMIILIKWMNFMTGVLVLLVLHLFDFEWKSTEFDWRNNSVIIKYLQRVRCWARSVCPGQDWQTSLFLRCKPRYPSPPLVCRKQSVGNIKSRHFTNNQTTKFNRNCNVINGICLISWLTTLKS